MHCTNVLPGPENYTSWWQMMQFMIRGVGAQSLITASPTTQKEMDLDNRAMAIMVTKLGPHPINAIMECKDLRHTCEVLWTQYRSSFSHLHSLFRLVRVNRIHTYIHTYALNNTTQAMKPVFCRLYLTLFFCSVRSGQSPSST